MGRHKRTTYAVCSPPPCGLFDSHISQISKTTLRSSTYMLCSDLYGREEIAHRRWNFAILGTNHWKDSGRCVHQTALSGGGMMAAFVLTVVASWGIYALLGMGIVLVYRTSRVLNI